jgi:hypothetical protein
MLEDPETVLEDLGAMVVSLPLSSRADGESQSYLQRKSA